MSYFIRALCRNDSRLTVGFVAEFLRDGVYFETMPEMVAQPSSETYSEFERIDIQYDAQKRPIIITAAIGEEVTNEVAELNELARRSGISKQLRQRIGDTRQVIAIEVDRERLTKDAWTFCDCFESAIASKLDAVIFAPDDGIYDANLRLIESL